MSPSVTNTGDYFTLRHALSRLLTSAHVAANDHIWRGQSMNILKRACRNPRNCRLMGFRIAKIAGLT
jgi:hypothetical protein